MPGPRSRVLPSPGSDDAIESSDEFAALDVLLSQLTPIAPYIPDVVPAIQGATAATDAANTAAGAANIAASSANTAADRAEAAAEDAECPAQDRRHDYRRSGGYRCADQGGGMQCTTKAICHKRGKLDAGYSCETAPTVTYAKRNGWYWRIGRLVYVNLISAQISPLPVLAGRKYTDCPFHPQVTGQLRPQLQTR